MSNHPWQGLCGGLWRCLGGAALCLAAMSTFAAEELPEPYRSLMSRCVHIDNSFDCARAIEAAQARTLNGGHFARQGDRLIIENDGRALQLRDDSKGDGNDILYSYLAFLPRLNVHVVHIQYYEGGAFMVISRVTGQAVVTSGFPLNSPDRRRFVTSASGEAAYEYGQVEVWRIRNGALWLEFRHLPVGTGWGPTAIRWAGARDIRVQANCESHMPDSKQCPARLWLKGGQWQIKVDEAPVDLLPDRRRPPHRLRARRRCPHRDLPSAPGATASTTPSLKRT
jgi:hypothetical protein